jgi:hypothetical protein
MQRSPRLMVDFGEKRMDSKLIDPKEKWQNWLTTLKDKCRYCEIDWHKHELWCPHYSSIMPLRCAAAHTPCYRSWDQRGYKYECNLCNMRPVFLSYQIKKFAHPLCKKGFHYWTSCGDGCCEPWCCGCGKKATWEQLGQQGRAMDYGSSDSGTDVGHD